LERRGAAAVLDEDVVEVVRLQVQESAWFGGSYGEGAGNASDQGDLSEWLSWAHDRYHAVARDGFDGARADDVEAVAWVSRGEDGGARLDRDWHESAEQQVKFDSAEPVEEWHRSELVSKGEHFLESDGGGKVSLNVLAETAFVH
jgi:hypothetical protein